MKHFLDKNDRKTFIDEVGIVSKKYNLEGIFGNLQQLKEINQNNNYGTKSVEQMINDK